MIDYNIISISKVKIDQLSEFYKKVFKSRYKTLTNHWRWWYRSNYLGYEPIILIADNKVVGQAGLISVKIQIEKEILPAIWFVDFAVLPEYQGLGLGKILTREWMNICPMFLYYQEEYRSFQLDIHSALLLDPKQIIFLKRRRNSECL